MDIDNPRSLVDQMEAEETEALDSIADKAAENGLRDRMHGFAERIVPALDALANEMAGFRDFLWCELGPTVDGNDRRKGSAMDNFETVVVNVERDAARLADIMRTW